MKLSEEVSIYIQTVKRFFDKNQEAKEYFIGDSDVDIFFEHLTDIAQKNFESGVDVKLTKEQFELLRRTVRALSVVNKDLPNDDENHKIFMDIKGFGKICLN